MGVPLPHMIQATLYLLLVLVTVFVLTLSEIYFFINRDAVFIPFRAQFSNTNHPAIFQHAKAGMRMSL